MSNINIMPEAQTKIDQRLISRWARIPTTIISDILKGEGLIDPAIRPLRPVGASVHLAGLARTVLCHPPDFGAVLKGVDATKAGEVLVIAAGGDGKTAVIGEVLCGVLRQHKAAGVVCDGAVRDVGALASFDDLPVYCRSTTARGPLSKERGAVDVPVAFGGVTVDVGDLLIGDEDGLICLSPKVAAEHIEAAEAQVKMEQSWIERLAAGETLASVFGLP